MLLSCVLSVICVCCDGDGILWMVMLMMMMF